ncbi:MAG: hypothetical protein O3B96_01790, partial [bacterium]|nr:hypothetical protein [bacterium]
MFSPYRLTSFFHFFILVFGFVLLIARIGPTLPTAVAMLFLSIVLFARLTQYEFRRFAFWVFLIIPMSFLFGSIFYFLYLEQIWLMWMVTIVTTVGIWLYAENLYAFYHAPKKYQPYSLEYLSLALGVFAIFFFSAAAFGSQLFLQVEVYIPAIAIFLFGCALIISIFWVSKIDHSLSIRYGIMGALILTELYVVLSFLPVSYQVNAVTLSVMLYSFIGIARAELLDKLT